MESDLLSTAVASQTSDFAAQEMCLEHGTGAALVAAVDSNSEQVRVISSEVETRAGWDDHLPEVADSYVAVCVYDIAGQSPPFPEGATYMAQWATEQELFTGNGIITIW